MKTLNTLKLSYGISLAVALIAALMISGTTAAADTGALTPGMQRCEYRENPLGIDAVAPRLSWIVKSGGRAQAQTAYRIIVATSREILDSGNGDAWDSGKVESPETTFIEYAGKPLESGKQYFWNVKVWDAQGRPSVWGEPMMWSMGLPDPGDWRAKWIGFDLPVSNKQKLRSQASFSLGGEYATQDYLPAFMLRKEFTTGKNIRRATVYATALGFYELHINGLRVGNDYFTPGWTDYNKRIYYQAYDITQLLKPGEENAIGGWLADGWYAGNVGFRGQRFYGDTLRLRAQIHIEYEDGPDDIITTDESWKINTGPIREADMQGGETYDARREIPGWSSPGLDDSNWKSVKVTEKIATPLLAYLGIPVRKTINIRPVAITVPQPGVYVFNMGQNFAGVVRLKVKGEAGEKVTLRFAEMLNSDGTVYTTNLRSARATDSYILKGGGEMETWEPRFTFHGFQYVEVTGFPGVPDLETITGIAMNSDLPVTGGIETSSPLVNKLFSNIMWGHRSNYIEVPTDCPQRDERLGWMGDAQAFVRTAAYNMDVGAFFTKWMVDVEDGQHEDGGFPDTAPEATEGVASGWADAGIICPWTIYRAYGDKRILQRHYAAMEKWMNYLIDHSTNYLARPVGSYADWLNVEAHTSNDLITNAYFAYDARLMAEIAAALGKDEDAEKYRRLFRNVSRTFNMRYVSTDGVVAGDTQTGYLLALDFGLLPAKLRPRAKNHLVNNIREQDWSLSTGFLGAQLLLPTLTNIGRTDVAYRLLQNRKYPSWGYSIDQGATTIWERWNSYTLENGFNNPGMNSFNHYAFGAVGQWMYSTMAGIDTDGPGFKKIIIRPVPGGDITFAEAHYDSIRGRISTHWRFDGDDFLLDVVIPANTTATVYIPAESEGGVTESGVPAAESAGVVFLRMEPGAAVFTVGSGSYSFVSKNGKADF